MRLRTFFADVLANLKIAQPPNHDRSYDQAREESGQAGKSSPKSQVAENTEGRKIVVELRVEQPVEQSASDSSCQLSAVNSQRPSRWGYPFFASRCRAPFPVAHLATLSTGPHHLREFRAPA